MGDDNSTHGEAECNLNSCMRRGAAYSLRNEAICPSCGGWVPEMPFCSSSLTITPQDIRLDPQGTELGYGAPSCFDDRLEVNTVRV
eukprot:6213297-Pleurochrysis_carterae.AAC.5